jgi:hypothetical protein
MKPELLALILLAAIQAADMATTLTILNNGGFERNKLMKWLFQRIGPAPAMLLTKGTLVFAAGWLVLHGKIPPTALCVIAGLAALPVINNLIVIKKQKAG